MKLAGTIFGVKIVPKNQIQLKMYFNKGEVAMTISSDELQQTIQNMKDLLKEIEKERNPVTYLTATEKRVLRSMHLRGTMGKCGSLNAKQRHQLLTRLIRKGMMDDSLQLTAKGIDASI